MDKDELEIIFERPVTSPETREKTREKIIALIKENPRITQEELAEKINISIKGIEWNLVQLKQKEILRRIGADKGAIGR